MSKNCGKHTILDVSATTLSHCLRPGPSSEVHNRRMVIASHAIGLKVAIFFFTFAARGSVPTQVQKAKNTHHNGFKWGTHELWHDGGTTTKWAVSEPPPNTGVMYHNVAIACPQSCNFAKGHPSIPFPHCAVQCAVVMKDRSIPFCTSVCLVN